MGAVCKYNAERDRLHTTYNKRLSGRGAEVLERNGRKKGKDGYKERKQNRIDENEMIEKKRKVQWASEHEEKTTEMPQKKQRTNQDGRTDDEKHPQT
jgi:hypothetical protein